jgi:hypothetical protein
VNVVNAQEVEAKTYPGNIHDTVHRPDLMEVDVFKRHSMRFRLRLAEAPKNAFGAGRDGGRQAALAEDGDDFSQAPDGSRHSVLMDVQVGVGMRLVR